MEYPFKTITIRCTGCGNNNIRYTKWMELGNKSILKAIWCEYCEQPNAVRFIFNEQGDPEIIREIPREEVFMPRKPETGITIKPRSRERQEAEVDEG